MGKKKERLRLVHDVDWKEHQHIKLRGEEIRLLDEQLELARQQERSKFAESLEDLIEKRKKKLFNIIGV